MGGMWRTTDLTRLLGCDVPIVQAPLGGGPGTPELTAAVGDAGGFGMLGGGYLDPGDLTDALARTRALSGRPFGVNLFLAPPPRRTGSAAARAALAEVAAELGLDAAVPREPRGLPDPDAQLDAVLASDARLVTFAFGAPRAEVVARLHRAGRLVGGTAQSAADARALGELGVDLVVAQGAEAGGHRGGLSRTGSGDVPGLVALLPAVVDAVDLPVMAAGGISDGRGVAAALALGAQAVALGTAFLRTPEAGTGAAYREALAGADETSTVTTRAFSGRAARGLPNAYLRAFDDDEKAVEVPDFPVMNYLSRPLRSASAAAGTAEAQSLWAGQGVGLSRELPAAELVAVLVAETENALARLR
jgi:nitronate monooxygenase